jgi:hypothetical protein
MLCHDRGRDLRLPWQATRSYELEKLANMSPVQLRSWCALSGIRQLNVSISPGSILPWVTVPWPKVNVSADQTGRTATNRDPTSLASHDLRLAREQLGRTLVSTGRVAPMRGRDGIPGAFKRLLIFTSSAASRNGSHVISPADTRRATQGMVRGARTKCALARPLAWSPCSRS